jgi:hypothetical protein
MLHDDIVRFESGPQVVSWSLGTIAPGFACIVEVPGCPMSGREDAISIDESVSRVKSERVLGCSYETLQSACTKAYRVGQGH